mgnify:CR=1 FL=1
MYCIQSLESIRRIYTCSHNSSATNYRSTLRCSLYVFLPCKKGQLPISNEEPVIAGCSISCHLSVAKAPAKRKDTQSPVPSQTTVGDNSPAAVMDGSPAGHPPVSDSEPTADTDIVSSDADSLPADTGNLPAAASNLPVDTGDLAADTSNLAANTGDLTADTGGLAADTGDLPADTGDVPADTGDLAYDTGGLADATGDLAVDTGDLAADTGDLAVDTGDLSTDTDNLPADTGNLPADSGSISSGTSDGPSNVDGGASAKNKTPENGNAAVPTDSQTDSSEFSYPTSSLPPLYLLSTSSLPPLYLLSTSSLSPLYLLSTSVILSSEFHSILLIILLREARCLYSWSPSRVILSSEKHETQLHSYFLSIEYK